MTTLKTLLQSAIQTHQQGQFPAAEQAYQAIIQTYPDCTDAMNLLAILYAQQQHYEKAVPWLEKALQLAPATVASLNHLAICLNHLGKTTEALTYLEQALVLEPHNAETHHSLGNIYQRLDKLEQAKNHYKTAINLRPEYLDAYLNLGLVYLKQQEVDEARYYFRHILTLHPLHAGANFHLGNIALQQERLQEALAHYEVLPLQAMVLINMGAALLKLNRKPEAIDKFQQALSFEPDNLIAHNNLATIYLEERQNELALKHYHQVITQQTDNAEVHFNLGILFMRDRKWESAQYHFYRVLQLDDKNVDAHVNFATTLMKLNRQDEAIKHYEIALQLRPHDEIARYRLAALTGNNTPATAPASYISALFDNYAENFDHELMDSLQYRVPEAIYKGLCEFIDDKWDLTVVDLGCGTGLCGRYFVPRTQHLIGVDLSAQMLKLAEAKHIYDELLQEDLTQALSRWQHEVDVITAADVLVYCGDLAPIFSAARAALTPEGYFAFTTENTDDTDYQLTSTCRYAHSKSYLTMQAEQQGFVIKTLRQIKLREQHGQPVYGWLGIFSVKQNQ